MTTHATPLPPNPFLLGTVEANDLSAPTSEHRNWRAGLAPAFENFQGHYPTLARIKPTPAPIRVQPRDRWFGGDNV